MLYSHTGVQTSPLGLAAEGARPGVRRFVGRGAQRLARTPHVRRDAVADLTLVPPLFQPLIAPRLFVARARASLARYPSGGPEVLNPLPSLPRLAGRGSPPPDHTSPQRGCPLRPPRRVGRR